MPEKQKQHIQLSVFDRLDQNAVHGFISQTMDDIDVVRKSVLRDVENLLNTRRKIVSPSKNHQYLNNSMYVYGVEDFVASNPRNTQVRKSLEKTIQKTIRLFEPRLREVQVSFQPVDDYEPVLCFTVRAILRVEPIEEPIYFNTWFSASRGEYRVDPYQKRI